MNFRPDPKPPKRRRRQKPDDTWRIKYRSFPCLIPGCEATPCCAAHWPKHRGIGGAGAGWGYNEIVPLCSYHHDLIDGRLGVSDLIEIRRAEAQARVAKLAPAFWAAIKEEYGL